jgi:type I restriction-modification system DNA methylase subunit
VYEDRYLEIVKRYQDDRPQGERAIDFMSSAHTQLCAAVAETGADVLGEIYEACITFGEHGQFFTPEPIIEMMVAVAGDIQPGARVLDPCCGSGRMLIGAGKRNPEAFLTGVDLDPRCAKMSALNMVLFDFNADILWGNSLAMQYERQWSIRRGGFIVERDVEPAVAQAVKKATGQQTLLAA